MLILDSIVVTTPIVVVLLIGEFFDLLD